MDSHREKAVTERRSEFYAQNYEIAVQIQIPTAARKHVLAAGPGRQCRYCKGVQGAVSFKQDAHAFPECIGNSALISGDECDECNQRFSRNLDSHFANYLGAARTISRIKGKRGIPSYKSKKGASRIDVGESMVIVEKEGDPIASIDSDTKSLRLSTIRMPYVPVAIYKSVAKMALAIMPASDLEGYSGLAKWIGQFPHKFRGGGVTPLVLVKTTIPGHSPIDGVNAWLFRRRDPALLLPYFMFVVGFHNYAFQVALQSAVHDLHLLGKTIKFEAFPVAAGQGDRFGRPMVEFVDCGGEQTVRDEPLELSMVFGSMEETEP